MGDAKAGATTSRAPAPTVAAHVVAALDALLASTKSPAYRFVAWLMASTTWWHLYGFGAALVLGRLARSLVEAASEEERVTVAAVAGGVAVANVCAFASYRVQWRALIGEGGLAPARAIAGPPPFPWALLGRHVRVDDATLRAVVDAGLAASVLAVVAPWWCPLWVAPVALGACAACYLALVRVSDDFLGLQSDANVVEVDVLVALCLASSACGRAAAPLRVLRLFSARKVLGSGVCKWLGSPRWQRLDVLHWTRPLVTPATARFHRLPGAVRRSATLATLAVEVACPVVALVATRRLRLVAWAAMGLTQLLTPGSVGGFVAVLGAAEHAAFGDDAIFHKLLPSPRARSEGQHLAVPVVVAGLLALYVAISFLPLEKASKGDVLLDDLIGSEFARKLRATYGKLRRFRVCNYQGAVESAHDTRWEIVLEGFDGDAWRPYPFRYKLNAGDRRGRRALVAHVPRLDVRLWFLSLAARRGADPPHWFVTLLDRLYKNDAVIDALFAGNPFPDEPPVRVRSRVVDFRLQDGAWSHRDVRVDTPLNVTWPPPGREKANDD